MGKEREFNSKAILILLVVIGIFFISAGQMKADNFAYTNGSYIYLNETKQFYNGINYITRLVWTNSYYEIPDEVDIQRISDYNFNAIRLPLSTYQLRQNNVWNNTAIGWLNNTLNWSKARNISVLLDLHDDTTGSFGFGGIIEQNQTQWDEIASFWSYLAYLYKNETTIIGYDLINEPYFYKPFRSDVNRTAISDLWIQWVNETYENDFDKLNKSWNGVSTFTTFDNDTNYDNTTTGLVLYWQLDNDADIAEASRSRVYDWSGNDNNGTTFVGTTLNLSGRIKSDYDIQNGSISTSVGHRNYTTTSFAMAFWMKCYNQNQSPSGPILFSAMNSSVNIAFYVYLYPANYPRIYTYFRNSTQADPGISNKIISTTRPCNDTEWKHVVFQYNGTQGQLYVNAILEDSYDLTSDLDTIQMFRAGWPSSNNAFNGSLDEIMFFNRSLNFSEIWGMSRRHDKFGDTENFSTVKIPSTFWGYDNDERHHTSQNIFKNPSFELWTNDKPESWTNYTPTEMSSEATDGGYSVKINRTTASSIMFQLFGFTTEANWTKDFVISFDAKVFPHQANCYLRLMCSDSFSYNEATEKHIDFSNISWNSYSAEWEIDPRFDACQFEFYSSGSCAALVDNFNVTIESHNNRLTDFYKFLDYRYKIFMEYLITEIRKNDTNHIIFFDSLGTSNGFHTSLIPMDFALPNDSISNKLVYAPHHYYNPSNNIEGWGYLMESYKGMNIPWIAGETGYNRDYGWIDMIIKIVKYDGSGYFHWGAVSNISALGYGPSTTSDAYYCNNISSVNCFDIVSGIDENNLSITPKGTEYKNFLNKFFSNQNNSEDNILLVYGDGSYNFKSPYFLYNPFKEELDKYDKDYIMISADHLIYNTSFSDNEYLNASYFNSTNNPDQTKINWINFDKILVVQNSYKGSARLGYLLEDMMKADKRVAFIGAPYIIQYPYYDFREDGYLGGGIGKENNNYSFAYWFNSTVIPNKTASKTITLTAVIDFYDIKQGQSYTFTSDSGALMNVTLPEGGTWIFQDCSWNTSNQLYLCGMPQYAGTAYQKTLVGDTINITQSILKWLYQDNSLKLKSYSYNMTYLKINDSAGKKSYTLMERLNVNLSYNLTFPYNTKVWNFINKTIECENCSSLILNFSPYEMKMFYIDISNVSLTEGDFTKVKDTSNNLVDDNIEIWFTSQSDNNTKYIDSNLTSTLNVTASFYTDNCSILSIRYVSETSAYSKTYTSSEWSCLDNIATLDITGLEPATGSNMLYVTYKTAETTATTTGGSSSKKITINNGSISLGKNYTYEVHKADQIFFKFNNTNHTIKIKKINIDSVDFEITSFQINVTVKINETEKIDLNSDKRKDISITVENIKSGIAEISIRALTQEEPLYFEETKEQIPLKEQIMIISAASVILVLIIITLLKINLHFKKKNK